MNSLKILFKTSALAVVWPRVRRPQRFLSRRPILLAIAKETAGM